MEFLQLRTGLDAEPVAQPAPRGAEDGERLVVPPGPVQRRHQCGDHLLGQRILRRQSVQLTDEIGVPPQLQLQSDAFLPHPAQVLHQPAPYRGGPVARGLGQRIPAPSVLGRAQQTDRQLPLALPGRRAGVLAQPLEVRDIDLGTVVDAELVLTRRRALHLDEIADRVAQQPAQPRHIALHGAHGRLGLIIAPDPVDQRVHGDRLTERMHQNRQYTARFHRSEPALLFLMP